MANEINDNGLDDLYESGHRDPDPDSNNQNSQNTRSDLSSFDRETQQVNITSDAPIIVFFGPRSIGKSVALVRLARYLADKDYEVEADPTFRDNDIAYDDLCDNFRTDFIEAENAPASTNQIHFLLLRVSNYRGEICQLLEAPGEHYFNLANLRQEPGVAYFPYFSEIIENDNLKVYVFFLEINWKPQCEAPAKAKTKYDRKIANFMSGIGKRDSVILLCNKADKQDKYIFRKKPNLSLFEKNIKSQYPAVYRALGYKKGFNWFKSSSIKHRFVAFSAGRFKERPGGVVAYTQGDKLYPESLWNAIKKSIQGRWF